MIRTYKDTVKYLESYIPSPNKKFPGQLGLDRMKYLCQLLGNPHLAYKTIHVGGTSGKGSTATIIASILSTKYKVGLHTSPHLEKVNERMKVLHSDRSNYLSFPRKRESIKVWIPHQVRDDIRDRELIQLINEVRPRIKTVEKSRYGKPTYFEITTALAFLYFAKKRVDFAVIEAGMGGRWDGTNVIKPVVVVLTNVGLDHTEILGDTVEKIAQDKVGIIKKGISVVSGVSKPTLVKIVEDACNTNTASLSLLHRDFDYTNSKNTDVGSTFDYIGYKKYSDLFLPLLGKYQVENATLAIRAIELLRRQVTIDEDDIRKALETVFIPGRLEIIKRDPFVILDGAHNPDKIKAIVDSIKTIFPDKRIKIILAIKKDKNAREMIAQLFRIADETVLTEYQLKTDLGDTYSFTAAQLFAIAQELGYKETFRSEKNPIEALRILVQKANRDDLILVTGSLYLIGEIRKKLNAQNSKFK